jgi:assimilatory nitrate reductase catalytic subunit
VKGFTAGETLRHRERLTTPLARNSAGEFEAVGWDFALESIARRIAQTQEKFGRDAVGLYGSGALTNEKTYLLGKFARVGLRTANIDYNGRFCMSSAAAAANQAFGLDRGLPFPVEDLAGADVILIAGGNIAETMPPMMQYLETQRARGGKLLVVDPRRSATADSATHLLPIAVGTDAVLAHGLLHLLIRERLVDEAYVEARTEGFDRVRSMVAGYWPSRVERMTGIPESMLIEVAQLLGSARSAIILSGRGPSGSRRAGH